MARVPFFFLSFSLVYHHYTCSNNLKIGSLKSDIKITRDDISTETLKIFGSSTENEYELAWATRSDDFQGCFSSLKLQISFTPFRLVPLINHPIQWLGTKKEKITAKSWWKERKRKYPHVTFNPFLGLKRKDLQNFLASFKETFSFILMVTWFHFHMGKAATCMVCVPSWALLGSLAINKRVDLSVHERGGSGLS